MSETETIETSETSTASKPAALTPHEIVRVYSAGGVDALSNERVTRGQLSKAIDVMRVLNQSATDITALETFLEGLPTQGGRGPAAIPGVSKALLLNKQGQLIVSGVRSFFSLSSETARPVVSFEETDGVRRIVVTGPAS